MLWEGEPRLDHGKAGETVIARSEGEGEGH